MTPEILVKNVAPIIDVDGRSVGVGEIVHALRNADVVDDEVAVVLRDNLADLVFDLLEDTLSGFDARGGRGADVKLDLSAVNLRKEVPTNQRQHDTAEREHQHGDNRDDRPSHQEHLERADIAAAKQLEAALERLVKTRKPAARARRRVVMLPPEQQADDDRRQGP